MMNNYSIKLLRTANRFCSFAGTHIAKAQYVVFRFKFAKNAPVYHGKRGIGMLRYAIRRLVTSLLTLFLVITLTFFLMQAVPGEPMLGENVNPEITQKLLEKYGYDKPLGEQYINYLKGLFTGDMALTWPVWGHLDVSSALSVYQKSLARMAALNAKNVHPAHGDPGNRFGCPAWLLPPRTLEVFARETQEIVEGKRVGAPYHSFAGDGLCVEFEIGGMAYDPNRIG